MKAPDNFKKSRRHMQAPDHKVEIDFVHGYRGYDSRNNVAYLHTGEIAYYVAGVLIVYDPSTHT
jgi:microtubule-associated protein-like 6